MEKIKLNMTFYPNKLHKKRRKGHWRRELGKLVTPETLKPFLPPLLEAGYGLILRGFRDIFGSVFSPHPLLVLKTINLIFT